MLLSFGCGWVGHIDFWCLMMSGAGASAGSSENNGTRGCRSCPGEWMETQRRCAPQHFGSRLPTRAALCNLPAAGNAGAWRGFSLGAFLILWRGCFVGSFTHDIFKLTISDEKPHLLHTTIALSGYF